MSSREGGEVGVGREKVSVEGYFCRVGFLWLALFIFEGVFGQQLLGVGRSSWIGRKKKKKEPKFFSSVASGVFRIFGLILISFSSHSVAGL